MPSIKRNLFYAAILLVAAVFALVFAPKTQALTPSPDKFGVTFSSITIGPLGTDSDTSASAKTTLFPGYLISNSDITLSWNSTVNDSRFDHYEVRYGCTTQNDVYYASDNYFIVANNAKNKSISWRTPNAQPVLYCKIWVYALTADNTRIGGANTRLFKVGKTSPRAAAMYDYSISKNTGIDLGSFAHMNGHASAKFGFQVAENSSFTSNLKSFNDTCVYNNVSFTDTYCKKTLSNTDYTFNYGKTYYYRATWYDPNDGKYYAENSYKTITIEAQAPSITLPVVETSVATGVTSNSANLVANITSLGGDIGANTHVWFEYYCIQCSKSNVTSTTGGTALNYLAIPGSLSTPVGGPGSLYPALEANTTYYYKAYAYNTAGTYQGAHWLSFKTNSLSNPEPTNVVTLPSVNTTVSYSKSQGYAYLTGNLTSLGGASSAEVGFYVWKKSAGFNTNEKYIVMSNKTDTDLSFYKNLSTPIREETTWCAAAYAKNSKGESIDPGYLNADHCFTIATTVVPDIPTNIVRPKVSTQSATYDSSNNTAFISGYLDSTGGASVNLWFSLYTGTNPDAGTPINADPSTLSTSGGFWKTIPSIFLNKTVATRYCVKAYAANTAGTQPALNTDPCFTTVPTGVAPEPYTPPTPPAPEPTAVTYPKVKAVSVQYNAVNDTLTLGGYMDPSSPVAAYPVGFVINKVGTNIYFNAIHLATVNKTSGNWTQTFSNLMQNPSIAYDTDYEVRAYWVKVDPAANTSQKNYDTRSILQFRTKTKTGTTPTPPTPPTPTLWPRVTLEDFTYRQDGSIRILGELIETGGAGTVDLEIRFYNVQKGGSPTNYQKIAYTTPDNVTAPKQFEGIISNNNVFPNDTYCFQTVAKNLATGKESNSGPFVCRYNPPAVVTEQAGTTTVPSFPNDGKAVDFRATIWTKEKDVYLKTWWKYFKMADVTEGWVEFPILGLNKVSVHANGQGYAWSRMTLPDVAGGYCAVPYAQKTSPAGKILSDPGQGATLCYPAGPWVITLETIKPMVLAGNQLTFTALGEITNFNGLTSVDTYFSHGTRENEANWPTSITTQKVNKPANSTRAKFEKQFVVDISKLTSDQYCYKACALASAGNFGSSNCGDKICFFISDLQQGSNTVPTAVPVSLEVAPVVILEGVKLNNPPTTALASASAWFKNPTPPQTVEYWFKWGIMGTDKSGWKETSHLFKTIPTNSSHYFSDNLTGLDTTKTYCFKAYARVVDANKKALTETGESLSELCFPDMPWVITKDYDYDKAAKKANFRGEVTNFFGKPSVNTWFKYYPKNKESLALNTPTRVTAPNQPDGHALFEEKNVSLSLMQPGLDEQYCFRACAKDIGATKINCGDEKCFGARQGEESNIQVAKKATALQTKPECQQVEVELTITCTTPDCYNVVVYDVLPNGVTYVQGSANPPVSYIWDNGKKLVWSMGNLKQGTYTIKFRQKMPNAQKQLADVYPDSKVTYDSLADNGTKQNIEKSFPETYVDNILPCEETPPPPPPPTTTPSTTPFSVDKKVYPPDSGNCQQGRIELTVRCGIGTETKKALDVMVVLDRSGSMGGQPMSDLKTATNEFIDKLDKGIDRVGVASYGSAGSKDIGLTNGNNKFSEVKDKVNAIVANGSTALSQAMKLAYEELKNNGRPDAVKVMIIFTDGIPNVDLNGTGVGLDVSMPEAEGLASQIKGDKIKIYTIGLLNGLGNDQNLKNQAREFMKRLASGPDKFYESPTSGDLSKIYEEIAEVMRDGTSGEKCSMVEVQDQLVRDKMWLRGRFWSTYNGQKDPLIVPDHFDELDRRINWTIGDMMPGDIVVLKFEVAFETADTNQLVNIIQNSWVRYTNPKGLKVQILFPETRFSPKPCPTMPTVASGAQCVYGVSVAYNAQRTLYWFSGIKTDPDATIGRKYYTNLSDVTKDLAVLYTANGNRSLGTCAFTAPQEFVVTTNPASAVKISNGTIFATLGGSVAYNARYPQVKVGYIIYKKGYPGFSYNVEAGQMASGRFFATKDVIVKPIASDYVYKAYAKSLDGIVVGWGPEQPINTTVASSALSVTTLKPVASMSETTFNASLVGVPTGQKANVWFNVYPTADPTRPFVVGYEQFGNGSAFIKIPTMVIQGKPYCYKAYASFGNATTTALNQECF